MKNAIILSVNKLRFFVRKWIFNLKRVLSDKESLSIIVYQPGKVGSQSVAASLDQAFNKLGRNARIYHVHALNKLEEREAFVRRTRQDPQQSLFTIQEWRRIRREIERHPQQDWYMINLVRDPVAMKVSALFQTLDQHIPDWEARSAQGNLKIGELRKLFFSKSEFQFRGLNQWYDAQIKALWGLDIFKTPFPHAQGYQIFEHGKIHLIIFRLEDLNRVAGEAFRHFLGLENFEMIRVNVGEEKPYAELYAKFKSVPLPERFLERAYSGKFARHFYTDEERSAFLRKWLGN